MNQRISLAVAFGIAFAAGISMASRSANAHGNETTTTAGGFAVVELFTSEGCSSCPPADDALMELVDRSRRDGKQVFALSFHVDYWNRLGWKDPFSSSQWSERQRAYSTRTGDNIYTPQCVVNGTHSFVGSEKSELAERVDRSLALKAASTVQANAVSNGTTVQVDYTVTGDLSGKELVIALVEAGLGSHVRAGENSGRRLEHTNVVRALKSVQFGEDGSRGSVEIDAARVKDLAKAQVIVFVQERGQGAIFGASAVPISTR